MNVKATLGAPWLVSANSPVGGGAATSHGGYVLPTSVIQHSLIPGIAPDQWYIMQFYRFRSGVVPGDHNCLGPEQTHFTRYAEEYCWEDFQTIINAVPPGAVVTDPATVACAWGRRPDVGPPPHCP